MPFKSAQPRNGYPLSRRTIAQKLGHDDPIAEFLDYFAVNDVAYFKDDFWGDAINLDNYALGNGAGASAVAFAINAQVGGVIRGTTGTANDATASQSLVSPAQWKGDKYAGVEFIWTPITAVTDTRIELGFTDVVPGTTAPVVNNLSTPTVNASVVDAAVDVYNHLTATTINTFVTIGTTITAVDTPYTPVTAVAAATKVRSRIQLVGNHAYCWRDGVLMGRHNTPGTDYIEGGTALVFWAFIWAQSATSKSLDLDLIHAWQER
jgi:hypothetical protein